MNGFLLVFKKDKSDCPIPQIEIDRDDFEDIGGNLLDYGLVVGARFQLARQLHAVGTYYIGLEDLAEESVFKHRSFQVYLTYSL